MRQFTPTVNELGVGCINTVFDSQLNWKRRMFQKAQFQNVPNTETHLESTPLLRTLHIYNQATN